MSEQDSEQRDDRSDDGPLTCPTTTSCPRTSGRARTTRSHSPPATTCPTTCSQDTAGSLEQELGGRREGGRRRSTRRPGRRPPSTATTSPATPTDLGAGAPRRRSPGRLLAWTGDPRPLRLRRARLRLARPSARPGDPGRGDPRAGGRGGHDRLLRRDRRRRPRPRHADPRGPARPAAYLPARPGLPARGPAGRPDRAGDRGRRPASRHGVRRRGRWPSTARGPGWPARAGSSSRAGTTPSWSRRSGATTCASRASSSSTSAASTTSSGHLRDFGPGPERRVGVLVDHLVPGSKESRIADDVRRSPVGEHVLVVGHPFVDVWAGGEARAARPRAPGPTSRATSSGSTASAPRSAGRTRDQADIARAWQQILVARHVVRRLRAGPARPGRGADRLRHPFGPGRLAGRSNFSEPPTWRSAATYAPAMPDPQVPHADVTVVVPAFNEEARVATVVSGLRVEFGRVVVVDDGSADRTSELARAAGAHVVRHPSNLGQGAALQTGFAYALTSPGHALRRHLRLRRPAPRRGRLVASWPRPARPVSTSCSAPAS